MATVGHTLVGLSLGVGKKSAFSNRVLAAMWIGLLVLFAHLVDIVEWLLLLVAPRNFSTHAITNSPWLIACVLAGCMALLAICRVRSVAAYLIAAAAVLSHVLLDYRPVRLLGAELYGWTGEEGFPTLREMIVAELWLFGSFLTGAALFRALRDPKAGRSSRKLSVVLIGVVILAAISRHPLIWAPTYLLSLIHASLQLCRHVRLTIFWNLVPMLPLMTLVGFEVYAWRLEARAQEYYNAKDYNAAVLLYRKVLEVPIRSSKLSAHILMSTSLYELGDLAESEQRLLEVIDDSENPTWPRLMLAYFYVAPKTRGTLFHRPLETKQLLESIVADPGTEGAGVIARAQLARMIRNGIIPDSGSHTPVH